MAGCGQAEGGWVTQGVDQVPGYPEVVHGLGGIWANRGRAELRGNGGDWHVDQGSGRCLGFGRLVVQG